MLAKTFTGPKNVYQNFLQGLKMLMENFTETK